jgi:hypothetical protein
MIIVTSQLSDMSRSPMSPTMPITLIIGLDRTGVLAAHHPTVRSFEVLHRSSCHSQIGGSPDRVDRHP